MAKIPEQIDKYRIDELVARGGMGVVYKGTHPTLQRSVILKKLTLRGNATITERFKREARILMDFRNDHIVDVQDHFVRGRSHYIVMEYVDGLSVKDILDEQRYLDNESAAYIILYTAKALRYAHSRGVVHRDIKPGNILISKTGEVKLADFGIAASRDLEPEDEALTADGMTLGTPAYMAPEQFENSRTVDYRADNYSLGVMFYEILTGLKPFPGGFTPETIRLIQKGRYKKPRRIIPTISPALQRIIVSLIKPRPKSRCSDLGKIIRKLEVYLKRYREGDVQARVCAMAKEDTLPPVEQKNKAKFRLIIAGAAVFVLAAGFCAACFALTGIHQRILHSDEYGQLRVLVEYPNEGSNGQENRGAGEGVPVTRLFLDDGEEIPEVDSVVRFTAREDGFVSLPVVLPVGRYRAKTTFGDKVIWSAFELNSWKERGGAQELTAGVLKEEPRPVRLSMSVHDAESGWDLADTAVLEVNRGGEFVPADEEEIYSGGVNFYRVSAPGYESRDFVLRIETFQDTLVFQVELEPEEKDEE